jgi:nicotinate-nucleotide pyrophosphorylase (carboxylating)
VQDLNTLPLDELFRALPIGDSLSRLLAIAAEEDLGPGGRPGDVTTQCCIPPSRWADGIIVAREPGILSGIQALPQAMIIFAQNCQLAFHAQDGEPLRAGQRIAVLTGPMYQVLRAERTMLNLLGRMSGIATRTAQFVKAIQGTGAKLLDTRKTTPGWRALEKYAVRCGGGHCHRIGLHDAVLFKDNHIFGVPPRDLPGWVVQAVDKARRSADIQGDELRFVELEVDSLEQLEPILAAGGCDVDIILLDNMDCPTMRRAVEMRSKHKAIVEFEASGGVTLETIRAIAETGVERISVGGLTHHAVSLDVSMDIQDAEKPQGWDKEGADDAESTD